MHAYTYSGHPTCCAVALRNIQIIEEEELVERAAVTGQRFLEQLRTLEAHPSVGDVRGLGMIAAVELVANKETKQLFPPEAKLMQRLGDALLSHGLHTRLVADTICLAPPLVTTDEQIDRIVAIVAYAIEAVTGGHNHAQEAV
jgi:adenosylmethionine-8-amino-7-oxononanoate aminotransferase